MIREAGPLDALVISDRELEQYRRGFRDARKRHRCPQPQKRPYPKEIVAALDDVADAAFAELGDAAYEPVRRLDDWLNGRGPR